MAGVKPIEDRRPHVTDMDMAGRTGSKTCTCIHALRFTESLNRGDKNPAAD